MDAQFSIKAVATRTGLSAHTIRAWEKRYHILNPARTQTNRRLFQIEDIERLSLLKQATDQGFAIGNIAYLANEDLTTLISPPQSLHRRSFLDRCIDAVDRLDSQALHQLLVTQGSEIGVRDLVDETIVPLLRLSGSRWEDGSWSIAQEHLVTAVIKSYVEGVRATIQPTASAPKIVVCTMQDQMHEVGALLVALTAAMGGWRVAYLGANMPTSDMIGAVERFGAESLAISISLPANVEALDRELRSLRKSLGMRTRIIVGGTALGYLSSCLTEINAEVITSLTEFRLRLGSHLG